MTKWHIDLGRRITGGKITAHRKKRRYEEGSLPMHTKLGKEDKKIVRTLGGNRKIKAKSVEFVNVSSKSGMKKVKIQDIIETPSDKQLARRGILTKGTIVKTELGLAKITSRPSQDGVMNAVALTTEVKKQ